LNWAAVSPYGRGYFSISKAYKEKSFTSATEAKQFASSVPQIKKHPLRCFLICGTGRSRTAMQKMFIRESTCVSYSSGFKLQY